MHAAVFRVNIKDREKAETFLKDQIVPNVAKAPGFVAGHWVNIGGNQGASIVAFESEDAAKQWAQSAQDAAPPADVATLESVEIGEVVAQA
jgi:heme-degrading monooxygenase HmoA